MNIIAMIAIAISFNFAKAAPQEVTLGADPWCPYTCEAGPMPGVVVEAAQKVLEAKGYKLNYKVMTWSWALKDSRDGKIDGAMGAGSADGEGLTLVEPAIAATKYCFFTKPGSSWKFSSSSSLEKISFGMVKDYTFGNDDLDKYVTKHASDPKKIDMVSGDDVVSKNTKKVLQGRIDSFIEDNNVVQFYLKKNPNEKLQEVGCLPEDPVTIALTKKKSSSAQLNKILSEGFADLKKSGELEKIKAKYGL